MAYIRTGKPKGFAAIDKERGREIARLGGISAQKSGKAHRFTSEEAREASRLSRLSRLKSKEL